jgi:hypothetical protein
MSELEFANYIINTRRKTKNVDTAKAAHNFLTLYSVKYYKRNYRSNSTMKLLKYGNNNKVSRDNFDLRLTCEKKII